MRRALVVLALCGSAYAGTTVVSKPGQWALRNPNTTPIAEISRHATYAECEAAAKLLTTAGAYRCDTSVNLTVTVDCNGVAKPVIPRVLDALGYVIRPPQRSKEITETDWTTEVQDYVPADAPTCWVLGWREVTQADYDEEIIEDGPKVAAMETWSDSLEVVYWNEISVARRALP